MNLVVPIKVELLIVGVFEISFMMMLLVTCCTVEVVDTSEVVETVSTDEGNIINASEVTEELGKDKVGILVELDIIDKVIKVVDKVVRTVE